MLTNLPIADFVPAQYADYRSLIEDGISEFVQFLPASRREQILQKQSEVAAGCDGNVLEQLLSLLLCSPALHKFGQVLARRRELDLELRRQLQFLEVLAPHGRVESLVPVIRSLLGDAIEEYRMQFGERALAEGSVATVVPFTWCDRGQLAQGVLKLIKPGIAERVAEDIDAMQRVFEALASRPLRYPVAMQTIRGLVDDVAEILTSEIDPIHEQRNLTRAATQCRELVVPQPLPMSTRQVTAMSRLHGVKVTDHLPRDDSRRGLAELLVHELVLAPFFSTEPAAIFHGDPHAGNLLVLDGDGIGAIDWCLAGELSRAHREQLTQIVIGGASADAKRICRAIESLAITSFDQQALAQAVRHNLSTLHSLIPDFHWLIGLLDDAARLGVRFDSNLMRFRKAMFTIEGVAADLDPQIDLGQLFLSAAAEQLLTEWPTRFISPPSTRALQTHLSCNDLFDAWASLPVRVVQWCFDRARAIRT